jgi:hypothetical protein
LKAIKFTTFAVWRWRKLASVTKSLRKAFEVFHSNSAGVLDFLKSLNDAEIIKAMRERFNDGLDPYPQYHIGPEIRVKKYVCKYVRLLKYVPFYIYVFRFEQLASFKLYVSVVNAK